MAVQTESCRTEHYKNNNLNFSLGSNVAHLAFPFILNYSCLDEIFTFKKRSPEKISISSVYLSLLSNHGYTFSFIYSYAPFSSPSAHVAMSLKPSLTFRRSRAERLVHQTMACLLRHSLALMGLPWETVSHHSYRRQPFAPIFRGVLQKLAMFLSARSISCRVSRAIFADRTPLFIL